MATSEKLSIMDFPITSDQRVYVAFCCRVSPYSLLHVIM